MDIKIRDARELEKIAEKKQTESDLKYSPPDGSFEKGFYVEMKKFDTDDIVRAYIKKHKGNNSL